MKTIEDAYNVVKVEHEQMEKAMATDESLLQSLLTGLSSTATGATGGGGYMGQLADAQTRVTQAAAEEEQTKVELAMNEKQLKASEANLKEVQRDAGNGQQTLDKKKAEAEKLQKKADDYGWTTAKDEEEQSALRNAQHELRQVSEVK